MKKRKLISFADSRMQSSLRRIRQQADAMSFFDEIHTYTELDLSAEFRHKFSHILRRGVRGYGFWVWKPAIILHALDSLKPGDELYYLDAGCHFNPRGRARLQEYASMLADSKLGLAAFQLAESECNDKSFTKMDTLIHMGVQNEDALLERPQICTGHIFCVKNDRATSLLNEWMSAWDNLHLIDDSPSLAPNFPEFVEHRHDQSIFSILCKKHGALALPGSETWPPGNTRNWKQLENYPIWDKRDLGFTWHTIERLTRKLRRLSARLLPRKG